MEVTIFYTETQSNIFLDVPTETTEHQS